MIVTPKTSPNNPTQPVGTRTELSGPQAARERAIQKLIAGAPPEAPKAPLAQDASEFEKAQRAATQGQQSSIEESSSPAPVETKAAESPKAPEEPLSSQYAILARKEKAIRQRELDIRKREAALKSEPAKPAVAPSMDTSKYVDRESLISNPFGVLNELGLSYDQLTELAINAPKPEDLALQREIKALREEMKLLKGESESTKKTFEQREVEQRSQAEKQIENEVSRLVKSDPNFEMIAQTGNIAEVVSLITRTFDEDGIFMSVEEAAQAVEDHLLEEAMKLTSYKKIQQKLASRTPAQQPTAQQEKQPLKTLTNSVSSSRPLTARERAILAMQGKLIK